MAQSTVIIIDPRGRFNYFSYYLYGFIKVFGESDICWNLAPFRNLPNDEHVFRCGQYISIGERIIYFDLEDFPNVIEAVYDSVDLYAKVNVRNIDRNRDKIFVLGPSFGISIFSFVETLKLGVANWFKSRRCLPPQTSFIAFVKNYLFSSIRRLPMECYVPGKSVSNYLFSMHTLWYDKFTAENTNRFREYYMRIARNYFGTGFEGGFFYIPTSTPENEFPQYKKYKETLGDFITTRRITYEKYVEKTKRSAFVFNTPAVGGCLGWKMAEYLAFGKAMISTPIVREMPFEFVAWRDYIPVTDERDIENAILILKKDTRLRTHLETNARNYFERYLEPSKVIIRLIDYLKHKQ